MENQKIKKQTNSKVGEEQIVDQRGAVYRIDRTSLLYRDNQMNAIYHCFKHNKYSNQPKVVSIKEYSQFMSHDEIKKEWDTLKSIKQSEIQSSYADLFLEFLVTKTNRHYLVMREFKQTLMEKHQFGCKNLKISLLNKRIQNFSRDISFLLLKLGKLTKNSNQQSQRILILTALNPQSLICKQQDQFIFYNFSNAIIVSSEQATNFKMVEGEGLHYYAPQMLQGKICRKSNVWMFGCILFEILCNGQKFIESQEFYYKTRNEELSKYIKNRIDYCQFRYNRLYDQNTQFKNYWVHLTQLCLETNLRRRLSVEQLYERVVSVSKQYGFSDIGQSIIQTQILNQLSYQYFRANLLQSKIFAIFDQIYNFEGYHNKYIIYIVVKLAAFIFLQNYQLSKERAEAFSKKQNVDKQNKQGNRQPFQQKYSLFLAMSQYKKIKEIKDKVTEKIQKWIQIDRSQYQQYKSRSRQTQEEAKIFQDKRKVREDIKKYFIQYQDKKIYNPHNILYAFCQKYAKVIQQSKIISALIAEILHLTKQLIDFAELNQIQSYHKSNRDTPNMKNIYRFYQMFNKCQKQSEQNPINAFQNSFNNAVRINKILPIRMKETENLT